MPDKPENIKFKKRLFYRILFIGFFAVLFGVFILLTKIPAAAEFFAVHVSQNIIRAAGYLTELFSFSLFEILVAGVAVLAFYVIIALIIHLTRKNFKRVVSLLTRLVAAALFVLVLYNFTMGFAYYRSAPQLNLPEYNVSDEDAEDAMRSMMYELYDLAEQFSDENDMVICPYTFEELCEKIAYEYSLLGNWFYAYTPRVKPLYFSPVLSYAGFSGIFFGPTGEPNINMNYLGTYYMPQVIAHELAHAKGVNREADAETVARYLLLSSKDPYLRYCGLINSYELISATLYHVKDYDKIREARPEAIPNEWWRLFAMQDSYTNPLQTLFDKINSWYINKNNQEKGSEEYIPDHGTVIVIPDPDAPPPDPDDPNPDPPPVIYKVQYSDEQKMMILILLGY